MSEAVIKGPWAIAASVLALGALVASAQGDPAKAFDPTTAAVRAPGVKIRVDLIGDSTQTDNAGYGRGFCANLASAVSCVNMARGGASTKTFRTLGLWDRALATKPDYMVIQFGHNDMEKIDGRAENDRQVSMAEYESNLRRYVTEARAAGIQPVLCTPLTRRYFEADGRIHSDLLGQTATMKRVAADMKGPAHRPADREHHLPRSGRRAGRQQARHHQEGQRRQDHLRQDAPRLGRQLRLRPHGRRRSR